jgi:hypothetical protein
MPEGSAGGGKMADQERERLRVEILVAMGGVGKTENVGDVEKPIRTADRRETILRFALRQTLQRNGEGDGATRREGQGMKKQAGQQYGRLSISHH